MLGPPSGEEIEHTNRGSRQKTPPRLLAKQADYAPIVHKNELNQQLREGKRLDEYAEDTNADDVGYTFGDEGSKWRMLKLKRVYEFAEEEGRSVEDVARERYGDLRWFDEAREEEMELGRREMYGEERRDERKVKPTGELWEERMRREGERKGDRMAAESVKEVREEKEGEIKVVDQSTLNRMRAALMKAQLRGDPKAAAMEAEFNAALAASRSAKPADDVVVLSAMDNRQLAGIDSRVGKEVVAGKKGKLVANDDMSISDMIREERQTKHTSSTREIADKISRDAKFSSDLDYLDENATKLATKHHRSDINLKSTAISDYHRLSRILDSCPLCADSHPPIAPVLSTGTRVYLSLPPQPTPTPGTAAIVPIQHVKNTLHLDDDEWEEIRNFMKSLTRYYASLSPPQSVIFTESSPNPNSHPHAYILAIPLPPDVAELAPAYFREAILASAEEWSTQRKIYDTTGKGRMGFRNTMGGAKEMGFVHVWFGVDGGMGHVVEGEKWDAGWVEGVVRGIVGGEERWGRERKRGRWGREKGREEEWKRDGKGWGMFDWTKALEG